MRVISRRPLDQFAKVHPDAKTPLERWRRGEVGAEWPDFGSVRQTFPAADVFEKCVIFNIGGNKYRLIAAIHFGRRRMSARLSRGGCMSGTSWLTRSTTRDLGRTIAMLIPTGGNRMATAIRRNAPRDKGAASTWS